MPPLTDPVNLQTAGVFSCLRKPGQSASPSPATLARIAGFVYAWYMAAVLDRKDENIYATIIVIIFLISSIKAILIIIAAPIADLHAWKIPIFAR
jgi:hypothetical protein